MERATFLMPPSTGLSGIVLPVTEGPEYEKKYQHYIDVRGEVLPIPRGTTTVVATCLGDGKMHVFL